jgi:hypothetical protein
MFDFFESSSGNTAIVQIDAEVAHCGCDSVSELMRAMILRTIEDFNSCERLKVKAIEYMYREDDDYVLSFQSICKHFGMDPVKTRRAIMNATSRISTRRRTL